MKLEAKTRLQAGNWSRDDFKEGQVWKATWSDQPARDCKIVKVKARGCQVDWLKPKGSTWELAFKNFVKKVSE